MVIGIYPNRSQPEALALAEEVKAACARAGREAVLLDLDDARIRSCELVLSIGGDGTVLSAARRLAGTAIPLWTVHTGGLGFLTDVRPEEVLASLPQVLAGRYEVRELGTLSCEISGPADSAPLAAINDVVVTSGGAGRMIRLAVRVDGALLSTLHADGVVVATAAGSTAYNLAAGGPILVAPTRAFVITPICPHTLAQRPVVVTKDARVEVTVLPARAKPKLLVDGIETASDLPDGTRVTIRRGGDTVRLVRTRARSDFEILREKLGWGDPREIA